MFSKEVDVEKQKALVFMLQQISAVDVLVTFHYMPFYP